MIIISILSNITIIFSFLHINIIFVLNYSIIFKHLKTFNEKSLEIVLVVISLNLMSNEINEGPLPWKIFLS